MQDKRVQDKRVQDKRVQDKRVQDKQVQDKQVQDKRGQHLTPPLRSRVRAASGAAFGLVVFPALLLYAALLHAAQPVPMSDDFLAILNFSLRWRAQPTAVAKLLEIITSQHNEYKLIVLHTCVAAELALTGQVHFGLLIWMGNLMPLGIAWLLWQHSFADDRNLARRLFLFAPIAWLLFQLNYAENFDWAMCGLQTMPVLLFSLAALHFLLRPTRPALGAACLCAVLGCFSSGNGFLMAPIGFALLLRARHWQAITPWVAAHALAFTAYLYRYRPFQPPDYNPHTDWLQKVQFFFSFLGAAAENMHHLPFRNLSVAVGVLVFVVVAIAGTRRSYREDPFFLCMAVWCLFTAAVVTQRRVGAGVALALTLRYKIYSDLLLIFCYSFLALQLSRSPTLSPRRKHVYYMATMVFAVAFLSVSDVFGYRFLSVRQRSTQSALAGFEADPAHHVPEVSAIGVPIAGEEPELARRILVQCLAEGLYTLPPRKHPPVNPIPTER